MKAAPTLARWGGARVLSPDLAVPVRLALAGLVGLAVGIEREWSGHASGPHARFAGVRTFLLLGLLGGVGGWLISEGLGSIAAVLLTGGAALAVAAYVIASRTSGDPDGTTEAAALLVLAVGALCGMGQGRLGSGIAAVAVVALAEKTRIQGMVRHIGEIELRAALQFAVLA
ncbi:MAG TPA: MgtC/SapB family protein, partial [Gemmatimonadales bacterium]